MKSSNETMTREEAIEVYNGLNNTKIKEAFEFFAPELAESEDEKIEKAIVDALLSHCNSINLLSARGYQIEDVKAWLEKQKEQKPNYCHYGGDPNIERCRCCSATCSGRLADEQKLAECNEVELTFRGEKVKVKRQFFRDDKGRKYSTTEQDEDAAWYALRAWCEKKGVSLYDLYPREEWSEEDEKWFEEIELMVLYFTYDEKYREKFISWLKSLKNRGNFPKSNTNSPSWSEEDEDFINMLILHFNYLIDKGGDSVETYKSYIEKLKSLRPKPYKEVYQAAKHDLAIKFMNYLDENRPEGKMCLSNGECEDIDKAFKENDWAKIMMYVEKYRPHWKPSEEQMKALLSRLPIVKGSGDKVQNILETLYDDLKKLM